MPFLRVLQRLRLLIPVWSYFFGKRLNLLFYQTKKSRSVCVCAISTVSVGHTTTTTMPALVVWEPLIAAGDDLYLLSTLRICLYLAEMGLGEWVGGKEVNGNLNSFF